MNSNKSVWVSLCIVFVLMISSTAVTSFGGTCAEYTEEVLWSSGYSNVHESVAYATWSPQRTCDSGDCSIRKIEVYSRLVSEADSATGAVWLSEGGCDSPSATVFTERVAHHAMQNKLTESGWSCARDGADMCTITPGRELGGCYSVKAEASERAVLDVTSIRYELCESVTSTGALVIAGIGTILAAAFGVLILIGVLATVFLPRFKKEEKRGIKFCKIKKRKKK